MSHTALLCAPAMRDVAQQRIYRQWCDRIGSMGMRVDALRRADYSTDPWDRLPALMRRADGVVVLGFRQLEITQGVWRRGTPEVAHVAATWTSPWLHVEAGMAIALGKPVLIAPEDGVAEGVFAPETQTANVFGVAVDQPRASAVERWAAAVRRASGEVALTAGCSYAGRDARALRRAPG